MGDNSPSCLKIALVAEQRTPYLKLGYTDEQCAALPHEGEARAVAAALQGLGHDVTLVPGLPSLAEHLTAGRHKDWDLVFNIAQGFHGPAREAHVPALLDAYLVPYTFSDAATMALCQNKAHAKMVLNHYGVPSAPFMVIPSGQHLSLMNHAALPAKYPLFVKPVTEGSSKGIDRYSKVDNYAELELAVQKLKVRFPGQEILVESFLSGRELTVSILGTGSRGRVIGIREHLWQAAPENGPQATAAQEYACWKSKLSTGLLLDYNDDHDMNDAQIKATCEVALATWTALGCRDAGRIDIRFSSDDADGVPNVLEVNPIAGLLPDHSPLAVCAEKNGIPYGSLLAAIITSALGRSVPDGPGLVV